MTEEPGQKMKIGFFDSGIGGLSVLHEAYHMLPGVEFIFYADTDHVPYGKKTAEEILGYARESTSFLVKCGVDAIVIACNTAKSVAVETLRKEYSLPIVSMEPAVKPAVEKSKEKIEYQVGDTEEVHFEKTEDVLRNTTYYASGRQVTDEDDYRRLVESHYKECPYYRDGDDYKVVRHQM